jgi:hypothetical protein
MADLLFTFACKVKTVPEAEYAEFPEECGKDTNGYPRSSAQFAYSASNPRQKGRQGLTEGSDEISDAL